MEIIQLTFAFAILALIVISGGHGATFTIRNNCRYTVWPGILTSAGSPPASSTGFELRFGASTNVIIPASWSGRVWGRTECGTNASGRFSCATGDCGSGQVACNGAGGAPPASLIEFTIAPNGKPDFYDVSLVDGFNLPVSATPQGGSVGCKPTSCPADINAVCPSELVLKGGGGRVIGCKSACLAFNQPEYCCTGAFGTPDTCKPSKYAQIFKGKCPQAYSYAYDDKSSTFTCTGEANYLITFCP
ncbi:hypothetical protein ACFE04_020439 [Oxalis oulophora]